MEERWTKRDWGKTRANYWPRLVAGPAIALVVLALLLFVVGRNTAPANRELGVRTITPATKVEPAVIASVEKKPVRKKHKKTSQPARSTEKQKPSPFELSIRAQKSYMTGDFRDASEALRVLVTMDTDNYYWRYLLGLSYEKLGEHGNAISELVASKSLNPDSWKVHANLARAALNAGELEKALPWAQEAVELDRNSQALNVLGLVWMAKGNWLGAQNAFTDAIALDPTNVYPLNNLGLLLLRAERFDDAIPHLESAANLRPDLAYVHNNLGICYERQGKIAMARDEFSVAISHQPDYEKAASNLERVEATLIHDEERIAASAPAQ